MSLRFLRCLLMLAIVGLLIAGGYVHWQTDQEPLVSIVDADRTLEGLLPSCDYVVHFELRNLTRHTCRIVGVTDC